MFQIYQFVKTYQCFTYIEIIITKEFGNLSIVLPWVDVLSVILLKSAGATRSWNCCSHIELNAVSVTLTKMHQRGRSCKLERKWRD